MRRRQNPLTLSQKQVEYAAGDAVASLLTGTCVMQEVILRAGSDTIDIGSWLECTTPKALGAFKGAQWSRSRAIQRKEASPLIPCPLSRPCAHEQRGSKNCSMSSNSNNNKNYNYYSEGGKSNGIQSKNAERGSNSRKGQPVLLAPRRPSFPKRRNMGDWRGLHCGRDTALASGKRTPMGVPRPLSGFLNTHYTRLMPNSPRIVIIDEYSEEQNYFLYALLLVLEVCDLVWYCLFPYQRQK